ncbi:hypothetical protein BAUCODRAFT_30088 [Baudoinia panamericana UAMH 10762]|uniref:Carboxylic ester hydrolase n=1 Tax=Baudoinia panamericana (strain UAMH 10762) TaxID=717646 RepID=M2NJV6_BAUPA|nr:uncharacterized protein BAUCODRAFT_30088 [Baudoinia panamericana UAMH 10762]EMC99709.1 hypothetical protein BAUCODRAFT_30088 [Baudoinia panamericana UAMH 10762]
MRLDVPLITVAFLGAATQAVPTRPGPPIGPGADYDRQEDSSSLFEIEREIERLEFRLKHNLEELAFVQHFHHRPPPPATQSQSAASSSTSPTTPAGNAIVTASIDSIAAAVPTPSTSLTSDSSVLSTSAASTLTSAVSSFSSLVASSSAVFSDPSSSPLLNSSSISSTASPSTSLTASSSTLPTAAPSVLSTASSSTFLTSASSPTSLSTPSPTSSTTSSSTTLPASSSISSSTNAISSISYANSTLTATSNLTSSISVSAPSISLPTSVSDTTAALQSLSSYAASLSSALASVSSVNATVSTTATPTSTPLAASSSTLEAALSSTPLASVSTSTSTLSSSSITSNLTTALAASLLISQTTSANSSVASLPSVSGTPQTTTTSSISASASTITTTLILTVAPVSAADPSTPSALAVSSSLALQNTTFLGLASSSILASSSSLAASATISGGTATTTSPSVSGTAIMAPTAVANAAANVTSTDYCSSLCASLSFDTEYATTPMTCQAYPANTNITITGGQATAGCGSEVLAPVDLCRVTLTITTSGSSEAYMEVWLPSNSSGAWNGRTLSTDNGGANGCVHYVDMQYVTGLGFAAIGDNGGHNSSAFDGGWMYFNNEAILDWTYRSRHASVSAGKQVVDQFYGQPPSYSYYLGCSTGGQQGMHSAQYFPDDFDGIISGSAAADMNHLQAWSGRFVQLTGLNATDPRFLTLNNWVYVQGLILDQCDAALDGVDDGIIEDPTICEFDTSVIPVCEDSTTDTDQCLNSTQISTVYDVFTELYDTEGNLLYPALLYGSQVDAFRLGQLSGSIQAISKNWYGGAVWNNSYFEPLNMNQTDYAQADATDSLHGNTSSFNGDLSAFKAAGGKLLTYHGMADPLVSGGNSQRYYLKVANEMGLGNGDLDEFYRYFRVSGMAHCGVGGISGAGAWMLGQSGAAAVDGVADNIIWNMVDWVESGNAPDTLTGTKFWYDEPSQGVEFKRAHCRFPYRTTYTGSGDWTDPTSWNCSFIEDWQDCGVGSHPRLCNVDGSFS